MARDRRDRGGSGAPTAPTPATTTPSASAPADAATPSSTPQAPPATPAPAVEERNEHETARAVGFWSAVGTAIALILAGLKSEAGRQTAGKAIGVGSLAVQLGWKHLTRRRGAVARLADELHPHAREFAMNQRASLTDERRRRARSNTFTGVLRRIIGFGQ